MKILITNTALDGPGGTELVVDELARELVARGHTVTIFTPRPGRIAQGLVAEGIPVVSAPDDIPPDTDIIHGQHHLPTMIALAALPKTPAVYFVHGYAPWEEQPPDHPRIHRYLCAAPRLCGWLEHTLSFPPNRIVPVPNWIDLQKFSRVRKPPAVPARAIAYLGGCTPKHLQIFEEACAQKKIAVTYLGTAFGNETGEPESELANYDIAFATGRSALEAMASGCAVIPFRDGKIAPLISADSFEESAERNFSVEPDGPELTTARLLAELDCYSKTSAGDTTARIRREYDLHSAVDLLVDHYISAVSSAPSARSSEAEYASVAGYLSQLAAHEIEVSKSFEERITRLRSSRERANRKKESITLEAAVAQSKLDAVEEILSCGAIRRALLRRIRSNWKQIDEMAGAAGQ